MGLSRCALTANSETGPIDFYTKMFYWTDVIFLKCLFFDFKVRVLTFLNVKIIIIKIEI